MRHYAAAKKLRPYKTCALMMDVRGRTLRTSRFAKDVDLLPDDTLEIRTDGIEITSTRDEIQLNNVEVPAVIRPEDYIWIGEEGLSAVVTEVARTSFMVRIAGQGQLKAGHSYLVKIPGVRIQNLPMLTFDDRFDCRDLLKQGFDYISLPNVQTARDLKEVKLSLHDDCKHIRLFAKIDTIEAIQNYESILKQADGIIIVRNELGVELSPEKLCIAQRWMVQKANEASVPIFLQSQVLEAMS